MVVNEGAVDRWLRMLAGFAIVALGTLGPIPGVPGLALASVGLLLLLTGALGWCPIYTLIGRASCPAADAFARRRTEARHPADREHT